jgi:hypothetical protein
MNRRRFIASAATAALAVPALGFGVEFKAVLEQRGYYLCFMRMPTFGLEVWREILDAVSEDGGNTVILWMGVAFRSKKYPITWQWAKHHANV